MSDNENILALARPEIRRLRAYSAAGQVADTIRLNANESPQPIAPGHYRRPLNRYPEVRPQQLTIALAQRFRCEPEQLLVTRGSSEAIDLLIRSFCRAGIDSIATPTPAFAMYRHYASIQGAETIEVATQEENDFAVEIDALLERCLPTTRILFVCSPNNPTGTRLSRAGMETLLRARASASIVVVDEAYVEFGAADSAIALLEEYPNLVILRTLSKALGFAGARCGGVIARADVVNLLAAVQAPYALATPVVECVEDALLSTASIDTTSFVERVVSERERLSSTLKTLSIVEKVWPSDANFLLVRFSRGDDVAIHCQNKGILLRNFGKELPNCLRISIGTRNENDALLAALRGFQEC